MRTKLVAIGNSRGVRLPKAVIEQCKLGDDIELVVKQDCLILRSSQSSRAGWAKAFQRMRAGGDDKLHDAETGKSSDWDTTEWTW